MNGEQHLDGDSGGGGARCFHGLNVTEDENDVFGCMLMDLALESVRK